MSHLHPVFLRLEPHSTPKLIRLLEVLKIRQDRQESGGKANDMHRCTSAITTGSQSLRDLREIPGQVIEADQGMPFKLCIT